MTLKPIALTPHPPLSVTSLSLCFFCQSLDDQCSIVVGFYGGYLVPANRTTSAATTATLDIKQPVLAGVPMSEEGKGVEEGSGVVEKAKTIPLPYVAQDNLELLTVELIETCLESNYNGGDILGQHPKTGEAVSSS